MRLFGYDLFPPGRTRSLIRIQTGGVRVSGETLLPQVVQAVAEVLQTASVTRGFIAIKPDGTITFSHHVPATLHQRLRNVMLNP